MRQSLLIFSFVCLTLFATLATASGPSCAVPGFNKLYAPGAGLYTGGEQSPDRLPELKAMGVKHVVDLRVDPTDRLEDADLMYHNIPVDGAEGLTRANAQALHDTLSQVDDGAVLVHCRTGKRAAALVALRNVLFNGMSREDALDKARRSGLGELESELVKAIDRFAAAD